MATSPPRRYTSLPLVSLLLLVLLLHAASSQAASVPASRQVDGRRGDQLDGAGTSEEAAADERCGADGEKEEECLMRRTLVAHTDYIYTQGGNHN